MGQFQDLKAQAAIIRDEQNSYQNTSLRVGRMFIDILEQLEKVLPDENVKPETLTVEATETSYKLKFSTLTSDGSVKSRELDLPIATDTKAGVMSPALMKGIKDQISQISLKVDSNKTDSDNKITELEERISGTYTETRRNPFIWYNQKGVTVFSDIVDNLFKENVTAINAERSAGNYRFSYYKLYESTIYYINQGIFAQTIYGPVKITNGQIQENQEDVSFVYRLVNVSNSEEDITYAFGEWKYTNSNVFFTREDGNTLRDRLNGIYNDTRFNPYILYNHSDSDIITVVDNLFKHYVTSYNKESAAGNYRFNFYKLWLCSIFYLSPGIFVQTLTGGVKTEKGQLKESSTVSTICRMVNVSSEDNSYKFGEWSYLNDDMLADLNNRITSLESKIESFDVLPTKTLNVDNSISGDNGNDYKTLRSALDYAWKNRLTEKIIINIKSDINILDEWSEEELHTVLNKGMQWHGVNIPGNTSLIGIKTKDKVKISLIPATFDGDLSLFNVSGDFCATAIEFVGANLRYIIHQDNHVDRVQGQMSIYKNCDFNMMAEPVSYGANTAIGAGYQSGAYVKYIDCNFVQYDNMKYLINGHLDSVTAPVTLDIENCHFIGGIGLCDYAHYDFAPNECYVNLEGNTFDTPISLRGNLGDVNNGSNIVWRGHGNIGARLSFLNAPIDGDYSPFARNFQLGCKSIFNKSGNTISKYTIIANSTYNGYIPFKGDINTFAGVAMEDINNGEHGIIQVEGHVPIKLLYNIETNVGELYTIADGTFVVTQDKTVAVGVVKYKDYLTLF